MKEDITPTIAKNNIDTFNKTEKSQTSNNKADAPSSNKSYKVKSLGKSRSTKKTETENTVNK